MRRVTQTRKACVLRVVHISHISVLREIHRTTPSRCDVYVYTIRLTADKS
nr:MAG TPA: hypothetical protein [Caudoviricetes sp.]